MNINLDRDISDKRVKVKLFMKDQYEELLPTFVYQGKTLIKQNVILNCQSESHEYLDSKGDMSDLEGYYC